MIKHLIHIGYPKAASTFLQEWFSQHPQIQYTVNGFGGFDSIYDIALSASKPNGQDIRCFVSSFEGLVFPMSNAGKYPTENGLQYYEEQVETKVAQKQACDLLKSLFPCAKLLVVTRGFKGVSMSGYSQHIRGGGRMIGSDFLQRILNDRSNAFLDIDYLVNLYLKAFGEENVLLLPFELVRDRKDEFLGIIEREFGLEHYKNKLGQTNVSLSPEELYWYPRISARVANLAIKLGHARYEKIYSWYIHQTIRNKLKLPIKLLAKWKPDKKFLTTDFPDEIFESFGQKATILRGRPLYKPYLAEYFLD